MDYSAKNTLHLGLVINPMAGVGGPAGLKGSDDKSLVAQALAQGADLRAEARAQRCLQTLADHVQSEVLISTYAGSMGETVARSCGFEIQVVGQPRSEDTSAEDTQAAVSKLLQGSVDILVFAGGDGTARDVCRAMHGLTPVLGIPTGVKMHSGVFAISPEAAAQVLIRMISGELVDVQPQEVRDIDEDALRDGVVNSHYFGELSVPQDGQFVQQVKQGGVEVEDLVLDDIAAELIEGLTPDTLYLVGAGTTPQVFMEQLKLPNTLLGVDAICNEALVASDINATELERLIDQYPDSVEVIVSITGRQGSLFGRGNQQFSARALRQVGRDKVHVLATKTKIRSLEGRALLMDSNDPTLDREWQGYIRIITGYRDSILYPLGMSVASTSIQSQSQKDVHP